ncbi:MAG TPA: hypothetical protein DGC76_02730 [Candidatus Accumulibacter sp.]|nr:hypothetical protein [Accumulibacter sp.]HCV12610.1 hypothetical protein [Accumulibacter sp.]
MAMAARRMPAPVAVHVRRRRLAIARIAAVLLVVLWMHWVGAFATAVSFVLLAAAAALRALDSDDRLALWIIVAVVAIISYLHNLNEWLPDGVFNRATDAALWKTELVLSISLTVALVRWIVTALMPDWGESGGS